MTHCAPTPTLPDLPAPWPLEQELWLMLASAAGNDSGIPQAILDAKAEEVRKRKEVQDAITVSSEPASPPASLSAVLPGKGRNWPLSFGRRTFSSVGALNRAVLEFCTQHCRPLVTRLRACVAGAAAAGAGEEGRGGEGAGGGGPPAAAGGARA